MAGSGGASKGSKAKGQGSSGKKASSEEGAAAVAQPRSFGVVAAAVVAVSVLIALLIRGGGGGGGQAPTSTSEAGLEEDAEPALAGGAAEVGREAGRKASKKKQTHTKWWTGRESFNHPHVKTITTQNFNGTMREASEVEVPLLVAFYDFRSASFKELRQHLEQTGEALANAENGSLGYLGACDATLHTFLARTQAPQMEAGWQENKKGAFKFGRPRFFPVIIIVYVQGKSRGEYTGVVNAEAIGEFVARLRAPQGGAVMDSAGAVSAYLARPGPFALACGMANGTNERAAFNESAYKMHGILTFGMTSPAICEEMFGPLGEQWPLVAWTRGSGGAAAAGAAAGAGAGSIAVQASANRTQLENGTLLRRWLLSHKRVTLEEMTPDNSHVFLDMLDPLLIFLVDTKDRAARQEGEAVCEDVEAELEREKERSQGAKVDGFHMVWSDCKVYGSQFDAQGKCPVFVIVNTLTLEWQKMPLKDLKPLARKNKTSSSAAFLGWMRSTSAPWRPPKAVAEAAPAQGVNGSGANATAGDPAEGGSDGANAAAGPAVEDGPQMVSPEDSPDEDGAAPSTDPDWFTRVVEQDDITSVNSSVVYKYERYQHLLSSVADLRFSFEAKYDKTVKFDWSDFYAVQKLHVNMRMLVQRPEAIESAFHRGKIQALWKQIEARAALVRDIQTWTDTKEEKNATRILFGAKLSKGYGILRKLFGRLYKTLHARALGGKLEPMGRTLPVDRRNASELSVREFIESYARPGNPVIITGLNLTREEPWTLEFFKQTCNKSVELREKNASKKSWGRLQDAGELPLAEFIDTFATNATRKKWYLHDRPLPLLCPEVFGPAPYTGFHMPKYFAGDYFQRGAFVRYQHSWPSLFVGSEETESALHVDAGGTNFWLHLLSGRKEWRFYSRRDLINLYWKPSTAHYYIDAFRPKQEFFPLLKHADLYTGIQEPGELMFIPGGNPHAVRNLKPIHGVSMNYVDASNVWMYIWTQLQEEEWGAVEMFTDNVSIPHGLRSDQQDLSWGEWKSTSWNELQFDIF